MATFTRVASPFRFLFAVNPVAVVYDVVDQQGGPGGATTFTSTAYATCQGHWFRGEERVTVALRRAKKSNSCSGCVVPRRQKPQPQGLLPVIQLASRRRITTKSSASPLNSNDDDDAIVDVEILSISKPANSVMGRVAWALSNRLQHRFFEAQLDSLERQAQQQQQHQLQQQKTSTL